MAAKEPETETKEPPRGFAVLIQQIDDGSLHAEVSETIQKVSAALEEHVQSYGLVAKGTVTLTLTLVASKNGTISVAGDVLRKLPKKPKAGQVFWLTKGGNLSPENPRQQKLPLRDVSSATERAKDLDDEKRQTRTV